MTFLTRVPLGRAVDVDGRAVAAAAPLFPLVGALVGLAGGIVADALAGPLPAVVAAVLALGVVVAVTGAMHVDALADTADALGGTTVERRLEIMRDHAVGAFGATAIALAVVLTVALASELAAAGSAAAAWAAAAALGRWAALPAAWLLPYARTDGSGLPLRVSGLAVVAGLALAGAVAFVALGLDAFWPLAAAVAVAGVAVVACRRWIGGVTGDTLGATMQVAELAALTAAVAAL
jgi:adenosylcobinamide-GDP ribazoletransferase